MNSNIRKEFIIEASKEPIKEWGEERKFDLDILKSLGIGFCNIDCMERLRDKYSLKQISDAGLLNKKNQPKYSSRIIIPYSEDYFAARSIFGGNKYKNLFPIGLTKKVYFIEGNKSKDLYLVEGETDAIRIKHIFQDANIVSIGGAKGKKLLDTVVKKFIQYECNRLIVCYDNDNAGVSATSSLIDYFSDHSKRKYLENNLYILNFDKTKKDIDEYFVEGGKIENLVYERKQLNPKTTMPHSIYDNGIVLPIDNYYKNAETFYTYQPYFYDKVGLFWFWDTVCCRYAKVDDVDVLRLYDKVLGFKGQVVDNKIKSQTLEAMKWVGREKQPLDSKIKWIQFKEIAFDLNGHTHQVTPKYFFTNPIPWELGTSTKTTTMDKYFEDWVGKENIHTLYEIIAYCCYRSYPIQSLFCLIGNGRNGKSCFLKLLSNFIGIKNIASTELDLLTGYGSSRFESAKLYKKLVCMMGETNFGLLNKSSLIKKLTGGDLIGYEMKNKTPFDDYNYAKMIIASNSLPISQDTSDGFYRRWLIVDFPNEFEEGIDILGTIPEQEYNNLALKITKMLPDLLNRGKFYKQGSIEDRKKKYIDASNPIKNFLEETCELDLLYFVSYNELYTSYVIYLNKMKRRRVLRKEFKAALEDEGYWVERTSKKISSNNDGEPIWKSDLWLTGLRLK